MKAHLTRRYRISASHRLHSPTFTPEQNQAVYGKCNNPFGHGHNYTIEVTVAGQVDQSTGMVCDLAALDRCVERRVIGRFDGANLNTDAYFVDRVPTTENLCKAVYDLLEELLMDPLQRGFAGAHIERVRIEETSNNSFEFAGKEQHGSASRR